MEHDICNKDYIDMIGHDQVHEVLRQQQIGATVISVYIRYLGIPFLHNAFYKFYLKIDFIAMFF